MASESIAHEAEGRMGYWLRAHSGSRNENSVSDYSKWRHPGNSEVKKQASERFIHFFPIKALYLRNWQINCFLTIIFTYWNLFCELQQVNCTYILSGRKQKQTNKSTEAECAYICWKCGFMFFWWFWLHKRLLNAFCWPFVVLCHPLARIRRTMNLNGWFKVYVCAKSKLKIALATSFLRLQGHLEPRSNSNQLIAVSLWIYV